MIIGFPHNTSLCSYLVSRQRVWSQRSLDSLSTYVRQNRIAHAGGCDTLLHVQAYLYSPLGHSVVRVQEASRLSIQRRAGVSNMHNILRKDQKFDDKKLQTNENRSRRYNCCVSVVLNREIFVETQERF